MTAAVASWEGELRRRWAGWVASAGGAALDSAWAWARANPVRGRDQLRAPGRGGAVGRRAFVRRRLPRAPGDPRHGGRLGASAGVRREAPRPHGRPRHGRALPRVRSSSRGPVPRLGRGGPDRHGLVVVRGGAPGTSSASRTPNRSDPPTSGSGRGPGGGCGSCTGTGLTGCSKSGGRGRFWEAYVGEGPDGSLRVVR